MEYIRWIEKPSPKSMRQGNGWFGQMNRCYVYNKQYCAMTREIETEWGKVIHCCFRNLAGCDIPWAEKQWLKDSLFGEDRVAIEVFPAKDRLVDAANMYHIWAFKISFIWTYWHGLAVAFIIWILSSIFKTTIKND